MLGLIYCGGLLVIGGALLVVLNLTPPWLPIQEVEAELVRVAIQVVVFGLAGGGVKALLDRQTEQRKFRSDMLERLGNAHKGVYRVRRLLAASPPERAQQLLGELMDTRQDLGAAFHSVRVWKIGPRIQEIQRETDTMRDYLEEVVRGALALDGAPERVHYDAFLDWRAPGRYEEVFKRSYLNAKRLVDPSFEAPAKN